MPFSQCNTNGVATDADTTLRPTTEDGRNTVGVAGWGGVMRRTRPQGSADTYQGCSNLSLNDGTPLALEQTSETPWISDYLKPFGLGGP